MYWYLRYQITACTGPTMHLVEVDRSNSWIGLIKLSNTGSNRATQCKHRWLPTKSEWEPLLLLPTDRPRPFPFDFWCPWWASSRQGFDTDVAFILFIYKYNDPLELEKDKEDWEKNTYHFNCIRERSEKIIMPELNWMKSARFRQTDRQSGKKPKTW